MGDLIDLNAERQKRAFTFGPKEIALIAILLMDIGFIYGVIAS
jgi:hypothetical protein